MLVIKAYNVRTPDFGYQRERRIRGIIATKLAALLRADTATAVGRDALANVAVIFPSCSDASGEFPIVLEANATGIGLLDDGKEGVTKALLQSLANEVARESATGGRTVLASLEDRGWKGVRSAAFVVRAEEVEGSEP